MPYLTIGARRHSIEPGETTLGGADAAIPLPGGDAKGVVAIVRLGDDGRITIRAGGGASADGARLDGEPLGVAPRPLVHGAKLELLGRLCFFGDERRSGGTERVAGVDDAMRSPLDLAIPAAPTADSGGRLVALADGRAWEVPDDAGLEIGRDPACDVVVSSPDASRWHATIERSLLGYVLRDGSTNGVFVNGVRVEEAHRLGRGDVVRIGTEEFRFEADEAALDPEHAPAAEAPLPRASAGVAPPRAAAPALLATLEILNEGPRKGERIRIEQALVRVGRSSRGTIVFADDSVSGSHAILERDAAGWTLTDLDSTNGSYVDGERLRGARRLTGAAELRFGNVKVLFRPIAGSDAAAAAPAPVSSGGATDATRGIVGVTAEMERRARGRRE